MKNNFSSLESFVNLKVKLQDNKSLPIASYSKEKNFSPYEKIEIYARSINHLLTTINAMIQNTTRVNELIGSAIKTDKDKVVSLKYELALQSTNVTNILQEFIIGFSATCSTEFQDTASVLCKGFKKALERTSLGYITFKVEYYNESIDVLNRLHSIFIQLD